MSVVQTINEYFDACRRIKTKGRALFRGQTKDYGAILPSLFRGKVDHLANAHELIVELYMDVYQLGWRSLKEERDRELEESYGTPVGVSPNWSFHPWFDWDELFDPVAGGPGLNYTRDDFLSELKASFKNNFERHADALLQHYGVPSRALDIAFNPLVALWFATHPYKLEPDGRAVHLEEMDSEGIVYVFDTATAPEMENLRRFHLHPWDPQRERIPYFGIRGVVQKGGLLFGATADVPDLRHLVVEQLRIGTGIWKTFARAPKVLNYAHLLPPPEHDAFYAHLLEVKRNGPDRFKAITRYVREYRLDV